MQPLRKDQLERMMKQHDSTWDKAIDPTQKNVIPYLGPFTKKDFPLLKIEKKKKEYYLRIDIYKIERVYVRDDESDIERQLLFYPTQSTIKDIERQLENDPTTKDLVCNLWKQLQEDGMGSFVLRKKTNGIKRIKLKKGG